LGAELLEAQVLDMGIGNSKSLRPDIHEALTQAAESAGRYLTLKPKLSKSKQEEWKARAEDLGYYAERTNPKNATKRPPQTFSSKGVDTKVRVLHKPEAMYTEEARRRGVTGTIVLSAVFTADGKVRDIRAIKALPEGLTLMAINAARRIRFMPAMKDGKPVSMFMQLEYNFNLY
jgi:TonB family protein